MLFNETIFIKDVIKDFIISNDTDCSISYNFHFNNLIKNYDIEKIFDLYINEIDIEDSKYRYGYNYKEIKINLILYTKVINYIIDIQNKLKKYY